MNRRVEQTRESELEYGTERERVRERERERNCSFGKGYEGEGFRKGGVKKDEEEEGAV